MTTGEKAWLAIFWILALIVVVLLVAGITCETLHPLPTIP
jgi:hypothetical protein